jgi:hypothetical protein
MYVLKREDQDAILQELTLIEITGEGWIRRHRHPLTGETWLLYYVRGEQQGGGFPVLREEALDEGLYDRLSMAFAGGREDDVAGLAWDLSSEYEKWPEVLYWLESNHGELPIDTVGLFICSLSVLTPMNRRPTLGKEYNEVMADYDHFLKLAERARRLSDTA